MRNPQHAATITALRDLLTLLAAPERWTQERYACASQGYSVDPDDTSARRWCITGGVFKVTNSRGTYTRVLQCLVAVAMPRTGLLSRWNDAPSRTHADVLALIDAAIERECLAVGG